MRCLLLLLLLSGCSNTSYMVPDGRKNTAQYNMMDSPDGSDDPNLRVKLIKINY